MIHLHLCTISFRHHLVSLPELATWAGAEGFDGIELWGVHARHLASRADYNQQWIQSHGLRIPMISDYLPLDGCETSALARTRQLCMLAQRWGAPRLRTFAGKRGSEEVSTAERKDLTRRLKALCECVGEYGLDLVVETHPGTLADTVPSTRQLLEQIDHPALGLNFDVVHIWESGANPLEGLLDLEPWVRHFHFKNVRSRNLLSEFAPANVYSPAGSRQAMVPLFEGACDYRPCLEYLQYRDHVDASLEWFGEDCKRVLRHDARQLRALAADYRQASGEVTACQ